MAGRLPLLLLLLLLLLRLLMLGDNVAAAALPANYAYVEMDSESVEFSI